MYSINYLGSKIPVLISRFTPEAKASRHPFVYLPFGAGPRNCVGMRLAQLEIKMALVRLFRRFSIVACSETKVGQTLWTLIHADIAIFLSACIINNNNYGFYETFEIAVICKN